METYKCKQGINKTVKGKLLILDAWTGPTSQYPTGKFGNDSLFNEGRASRIGVSKPINPSQPIKEADNDPVVFQRFKQLLHCAGFPSAAVHVENSVFDVCVADEGSDETLIGSKRRRRKRSTDANNYSIRDNWWAEKEKLTSRLIEIAGT